MNSDVDKLYMKKISSQRDLQLCSSNVFLLEPLGDQIINTPSVLVLEDI
jgi:hypothetical protein